MEEWIKVAQKFLQQSVTIHIYSFPNFTSECFIALLIFTLYVLLILDASNACKRWSKIKTNAIYYDMDDSTIGQLSSNSIQASISHFRETYSSIIAPSYVYSKKCKTEDSEVDCLLSKPEKKRYADQLLSITPQQYVKMQMEQRLKQSKCMLSLSTLCKNIVNKKYSQATLSQQLELAKEDLLCNRMTLESKYVGFKSKSITESLFDLLEGLINSSSVNKPLPFKGDITTLALDVADLTAASSLDDNKYENIWGKKRN